MGCRIYDGLLKIYCGLKLKLHVENISFYYNYYATKEVD